MNHGADLALVWMTVPDVATGERIGRVLVDERLAACANVIPGVVSVYRWEGEVRTDGEAQVLLKTRRTLVERLFARAAELHPYEVPELVATDLNGVAGSYRKWVLEETEHQPGGEGRSSPAQTRVDDGSE